MKKYCWNCKTIVKKEQPYRSEYGFTHDSLIGKEYKRYYHINYLDCYTRDRDYFYCYEYNCGKALRTQKEFEDNKCILCQIEDYRISKALGQGYDYRYYRKWEQRRWKNLCELDTARFEIKEIYDNISSKKCCVKDCGNPSKYWIDVVLEFTNNGLFKSISVCQQHGNDFSIFKKWKKRNI